MPSLPPNLEDLQVLRESVMDEAEMTYRDLRHASNDFYGSVPPLASKLSALAAYATVLRDEIVEAEYVADGGRRPL